MLRRVVLFLLSLGLVASPAAVLTTPAWSVPLTYVEVDVTRVFSPNGDGRRDEAVVRYAVPETGRVSLVVTRDGYDKPVVHRSVQLGEQSAGEHTWRWDGREDGGARLPDGYYAVEVTLTRADGTTVMGQKMTLLDVSVAVLLEPGNTYGRVPGATLAVYPRTEVVRDEIPLLPTLWEDVEWATLIIKDRGGRTVLSRDVTKWRTSGKHDDAVSWTARHKGEPLPAGRYRAFIRAEDLWGNTGRSDVVNLRVSRKLLTWRRTTQVVSPASSAEAEKYCGFTGCYDDDSSRPCGTVAPSTVYPGGRSYRSGECSADRAGNVQAAGEAHYLAAPDAVRGMAAARVAFTGRPTVEGEADLGWLALYGKYADVKSSTVTSSTGAQTEWVSCPSTCMGGNDPDFVPGVLWHFRTSGDDAVEVDRFTVTMRYLAASARRR